MKRYEYLQLKTIIKDRQINPMDIIDMLEDKTTKELLEYLTTHCNCGQPLKEHDQELGICGECR